MLHDPKRETEMKAKIILLDAANYMEEHGWCQHTLHINGRVCLLGAISAVNMCDENNLILEIVDRLRRATKWSNLPLWNDKPGRTKKQVVNALRRAANYLRRE